MDQVSAKIVDRMIVGEVISSSERQLYIRLGRMEFLITGVV